MIKIPVHSQIDLITNSSSEIFVHSENSLEPAKELLSEFLKINGSDKNVDEVFELSTEIDDNNLKNWFEYNCEYDDEELWEELGLENMKYDEQQKKIKEIVQEIKDGKREMPESLNSYNYQTYLVIKSKDSKYDKFLSLLNKLLYSPDYFQYSND